MNLQQLKVFVHTVELKKLYLVAQKLEITQPTVTFHLNKLQETLGVSLFHSRSYHVIKLTDTGKAFYHYASQISALCSEAETLIELHRDTGTSRLAIGSTHTPATYMLPPLFKQLKHNYPRLSILLDVRPAPVILDRIKRYELDIGIISQTEIHDSELIAQPLVQDDLVLIFNPDHPLSHHRDITPDMLVQYPFISHETGSISRQLIDQWAERQGVQLNICMEVSGSEALKASVRCGLGFGMISATSIRGEQEDQYLTVRPIPDWTPNRYIYAVRHQNKLATPTLRTFWQMLETNFKNITEQ